MRAYLYALPDAVGRPIKGLDSFGTASPFYVGFTTHRGKCKKCHKRWTVQAHIEPVINDPEEVAFACECGHVFSLRLPNNAGLMSPHLEPRNL